jgi:hypothetical protein
MRNVTSVLLPILLFFQLTGYLFIFEVQRYQIKKEIKHRIKHGVPQQELVLFKIPISQQAESQQDFQWKDKREFRYGGQMYDVVFEKNHHDTTWIYCISDEKETQLFTHLDKQINQSMNQNRERKQQRDRGLLLFSSVYLHFCSPISFFYSEGEYEFLTYSFTVNTWIESPLTPPPKT